MQPLVPRKKVAEILAITLRTLDRWCTEGLCGIKLRRHKYGRSVRFSWGDIQAFKKALENRPLIKTYRRTVKKLLEC